jgi:hypothetical protein
MPPRLPVRGPSLGLLAVSMLATLAAPALAFEIATVTVARDESGQLWVTTRLTDPLETRVEKSLERGMPATLMLHAELWRRRTGWFGRMEHAADAIVRLRHDVWRQEWRLERAGAPPLLARDVDSLEIALSRPLVLEIPGLDRVPEDGRCYVVVTATVKPLSVEDAEEVEGWVSGEVHDQGHAGFGIITQLPRSLFDAVRNFTGFGDSRDQAQTPEFTPGGLPIIKR